MLRRLLNEAGAIVSCGGDEGLLLDRDEWFFLREACEAKRFSSATKAWQPLKLAESFWARTSVVGHPEFLR